MYKPSVDVILYCRCYFYFFDLALKFLLLYEMNEIDDKDWELENIHTFSKVRSKVEGRQIEEFGLFYQESGRRRLL